MKRGDLVRVQWWAPGGGEVGVVMEQDNDTRWWVFMPKWGESVTYGEGNLELVEGYETVEAG